MPTTRRSSIDFSKAVDHRSIAAITKIDNEWARAFIYDNTKILQAVSHGLWT